MSKIIGIDLGTTYSRVAVWDERRQEPILIPNLAGEQATPSVVGLNEAGDVVVGSDAKLNYIFNPGNTVCQIKREMGRDFKVTMGGKVYNPQTISAFILRYLKICAEKYLGETVHDAVITVPAYFTEVGRGATRDAGKIAGLNVLQLVNEPTAAAIAYHAKGGLEAGHSKIYVVYDLGGGNLDVSVVKITADDISVVGTRGDPRLGGLDMDEEMVTWALHQIKAKHGRDLGGDEAVKRRLTLEVETVKTSLIMSESTVLTVPYLTTIDGEPFNLKLPITRSQYEFLIQKLLDRSLMCLEEAVASSQSKYDIGWEDLDGVLLVGGPTRLQKIRVMLRDKFLQKFAEQGCPDRSFEVKCDVNPDEMVTMGAAIVAASIVPLGRPPEEVDKLSLLEIERLRQEQGRGAGEMSAPGVAIFDVTGHSLGIGIPDERGVLKFHRIIDKETVIPVSQTRGPFGIAADAASELLIGVYQGEDESVQGNIKIGEIRITGLDPRSRGQQSVEITFMLDASGVLSTVCTDLRTKRSYEASFKFDGIARMSKEEIETKRQAVARAMASRPAGAATAPSRDQAGPAPCGQPPSGPIALEDIPSDRIPTEWMAFWEKGKNLLLVLPPNKNYALLRAMDDFASALRSGKAQVIEEKGYLLQDTIIEAGILIEGPPGEIEQISPQKPLSFDENVQFTVYRPRTVQPAKWYPLVAFAHLSERPPDAPASEPDPVQEVKRQARQVLGERAREYQELTQDSRQAVPREGELTFLPEVAGVEFNPPSRSFLWLESVHREEFRLRVSEGSIGQTLRGHLSVFLGRILLADVPLAFRVEAASTGEGDVVRDTEHARPYRKIFASYSHHDLKIVEEVERYARTVGDSFLRDWVDLRSGEVWSERLEQMIEEADIFQLFWSTAAMTSPFVRQEWECALSLNRPAFIRPVYWEDPFPESSDGALPPADLRRLHFQRLARPEAEPLARASMADELTNANARVWDKFKSVTEESKGSLDSVTPAWREGNLSCRERTVFERSSASPLRPDDLSRVCEFDKDVRAFLERTSAHQPQTPDAFERIADRLRDLAQRGRHLRRDASSEALRILDGLTETIDKQLRMISETLEVLKLVSDFNAIGKRLQEHPPKSLGEYSRIKQQLSAIRDKAAALPSEASRELIKVLNDVLQRIGSPTEQAGKDRSVKRRSENMTLMQVPWVGIALGLVGLAMLVLFFLRRC